MLGYIGLYLVTITYIMMFSVIFIWSNLFGYISLLCQNAL